MKQDDEIDIQRRYYQETAAHYGASHMKADDEHYFALAWLAAVMDHFDFSSLLDVGSGTGRAVTYFLDKRPNIRVIGIEPSRALREVGHRQGISEDLLIDGDATVLQFNNGAFDVVCEFGVLHHIKEPKKAVAEMLRVARRAVFISDGNHFGSGSLAWRTIKYLLASFGLWDVAYWLRSGGKGYRITEGDGLAYPYSVFNDYAMIKRQCSSVHIMNTRGGDISLYRTAGHIALLGIKKTG